MGTVAEAETLADWVALHNRNLETIYITHGHFDHFYGLGVLLDRFPSAPAIATPKTVEAMQSSFVPALANSPAECFLGKCRRSWSHLSPMRATPSRLRATNCASSSRAAPIAPIRRLTRSIDRPDRRWRRCVQPMPHIRRRHHPREPEELDRGARPVSGAEPGDCCRRSQEAWRARLSLDDPGHQRYLQDFDRLQKTATSDQELFDQMTELYPHWVANQSWLMFGFPQP